MYIFEFFLVIFYSLILFAFGMTALLMCCGPDLKNSDLNIMSDNQSPRDMYEFNNENQDKDN